MCNVIGCTSENFSDNQIYLRISPSYNYNINHLCAFGKKNCVAPKWLMQKAVLIGFRTKYVI